MSLQQGRRFTNAQRCFEKQGQKETRCLAWRRQCKLKVIQEHLPLRKSEIWLRLVVAMLKKTLLLQQKVVNSRRKSDKGGGGGHFNVKRRSFATNPFGMVIPPGFIRNISWRGVKVKVPDI